LRALLRRVGLAEGTRGRAVSTTYARFDIADILRVAAADADRLHESTSPGAIADAQRGAVAEAICALPPGATVADVSAAAILPAEVVRRRLAEMGIAVA
jgi:hypothetical protein